MRTSSRRLRWKICGGVNRQVSQRSSEFGDEGGEARRRPVAINGAEQRNVELTTIARAKAGIPHPYIMSIAAPTPNHDWCSGLWHMIRVSALRYVTFSVSDSSSSSVQTNMRNDDLTSVMWICAREGANENARAHHSVSRCFVVAFKGMKEGRAH